MTDPARSNRARAPAGVGLRRRERRGPIGYMARNGVAANLLMFFILAAGLLALPTLVQEVFPEVSLDRVLVSVSYPGATPNEVEESIVLRIEEQVAGVAGLRRMMSTASEGAATVLAEVEAGENPSRFLEDVKARIDRIATLPAGAERPEVAEVTNRQSVMRIVIHGDASERALKELAYRIEDELAALPEISQVETSGVREYEMSIEVPQRQLRALGLTLADVSGAVRRGSLELSAGSIDTREEEVRIRTTGQNYTQQDFEEIVVVSRTDGTLVRLGEIAAVRDGFRDVDLIGRYEGQPAAYVDVYRTADENAVEIADAVEEHLGGEVVPSLPAGIGAEVWNSDADVLRDRLGLLVSNGLLGLALVLLALALFLEIRLAFWVAVGIALSFVGTLAVMAVLGLSINMVSLFAFILAVGIVVDDAILVGENIHAERERGSTGIVASVRGARRIARPVVFAVLTTGVAFCPLFFIPGSMRVLAGQIPIIVISVLVLSLIESLLILPHHLSHQPAHAGPSLRRRPHPVRRIRSGVESRLRWFIAGPLDRSLRFATARPELVIACGVASVILSVALIPAGIVRVVLFPPVEADVVTASLEMPAGTPVQRTSDVVERLEAAGREAARRLASGGGTGTGDPVRGVNVTVGLPARVYGPGGDWAGRMLRPQANVAAVEFRLARAGDRDLSATDLEREWREVAGPVAGAGSLTISAELVDLGAPVHVELSHPDPDRLAGIGDALAARLREVAGVFDVKSDQEERLTELQLDLLPAARTLGLTLDDLARQVRAAFFGEEALRVQRGREEMRVYVRLPPQERDALADVEGYLVRVPAGGEVPLGEVASIRFGHSPATIQRRDGERIVTVTAGVNAAVTAAQDLNSLLDSSILPALADGNPGLAYSFAGEREQAVESVEGLLAGFALAMLAIYALLAIPLGSYLKPLIIMATIPFGIVGAVLGHVILGIPMGILSLLGIVGVSGVVVNDSLVMIDFIDERMREGMPGREAIVAGAKARFRPILLTSVTTFLGVAPLIFEGSVQAQFLIPMAAALGFGILFATVVLMMIVPALTMVQYRVAGGRP